MLIESISKCNGSVAEDDTKGKEEAGASGHTKKNIKHKVELQGTIEELSDDVHCCRNNGQVGFKKETIMGIAECVRMEDMMESVNDGVEVNFAEPEHCM